MWYLTSNKDPRVIYVLPRKEVFIGRSVDAQYCNFAFPNDPSLSRKHATLSVSEDGLFLEDLGSKYGTFINNCSDKMQANLKVKINTNDIIKFGKMDCIWKVQKTQIITCTSTFKGENLQNLKILLNEVGGVLKSDWDASCLYLTMPAITLTIKVVLALVQGSYIVNTEFWSKCAEALTNNTVLPDPKNFIPEIAESTLNKENVCFLPNDRRKSLFAGKTIIFFSKRQLNMYETVLSLSSATSLLLSEAKMSKSMLCDSNVIVIQYNCSPMSQKTQAQEMQINEIVNFLKSKHKRVVADAEIGLAILYCSLNKYCNPDFNFSSEVIKQTSNQVMKSCNILAHESEDPNVSACKTEKVVINETVSKNESFNNELISNSTGSIIKRKLSEEDMVIGNPSKKLSKETPKMNETHENRKRVCEDSDDIISNPLKKIALEKSDVKEDDAFHFIEPSVSNYSSNNSNKKLNFLKPLKRKQESVVDDEELFNFVENKSKCIEISKDGIFDSDKVYSNSEMNSFNLNKDNNNEKINISALRGIKLKELMEYNAKISFNKNPGLPIKTEDISDIDGKLHELDLGSTTVIVRNNLIVKKEPIYTKLENNKVKNFKKFQKVWPVKMQVTFVSG